MSTSPLRLAYSPCPNDTFIFEALVHGRTDSAGLQWEEPVLADVEQLNQWAMQPPRQGAFDLIKLSYHAYSYVQDDYALLSCGSALGRGCGPLLVSLRADALSDPKTARIAVPGAYTTALFLLRAAYPDVQNTVPTLFSDIEDAVLGGQAQAGLLIHENRFTYAERGLLCLKDLGEWWESTTGYPIPLGCIAVRRGLGEERIARIESALRAGIAFALEQPQTVMPYVRRHAQAMSEEVMRKHINLYVNDFTLDLGQEGRAAVEYFLQLAAQRRPKTP